MKNPAIPEGEIPAYPAMTTWQEVGEIVENLNGHADDDWSDGPLSRWLERFGSYSLKRIPITDLDLAEHEHDPSLAAEYADMDPATMPPIVFDPVSGSIIDGNHRANAAALNGASDIAAYVGDISSLDLNWTPPEI